jgi:hypothetical protein
MIPIDGLRGISHVNKTSSVTKADKKSASSAPKFHVDSEKSEALEDTRAATFIPTAIDPLFSSLWQDPNPNHRGAQYAKTLLEELDILKSSLVLGKLSPQTLKHLNHLIQNLPKDQIDPQLHGILREIETRAKVELAKLEMSLNSSTNI